MTHQNTVNPAETKACSISESAKNERLFLLSKEEPTYIHPAKGNKTTSTKQSIKRTINRKHITFENTINYRKTTYKINNGKDDKQLGLYVEPLERIIEHLKLG